MARFAKDEPFFGRPAKASDLLLPFIDEAVRIRSFVPPFRFTRFFSPEDTLLCVCASEAAIAGIDEGIRASVVELTTGSGLVGLDLLLLRKSAELLGLDVDRTAIDTASGNARVLKVDQRARFECADLWSDATMEHLREYNPQIIICNPPYVPEPDSGRLQIEAGAGADGTAHLIRTIEIIEEVRPDFAALSWCSLSDPAKVVTRAHEAGYALDSLFIVAISDGEYSGSVHPYLQTLPRAYICERNDTLAQVAPDGSARFAYLLMAGVFVSKSAPDQSAYVESICRNFSQDGLTALVAPLPGLPTQCWLLDRWDELRLRAFLH
jgi:hypothetical protein